MRYALLDRDGTIIVEKHYLQSIADLELIPQAVEGLRRLAKKGFGLVVITNQSGIGRGLVTTQQVEEIHQELVRRLAAAGVAIAKIYYCPHAPQDDCQCRKPRIALAQQAATDFGFDTSNCLVIGDKTSDVEFGRNINARTVLVRTGYGKEHEQTANPDSIATDLLEAADQA